MTRAAGGEFELIAQFREALGRAASEASGPEVAVEIRLGSGDDAAVTVPAGATVTSVDALVEGVHFRRETAPLDVVGRKALAVALSDLAAMAATPGEAYVQVGIPPDLDRESSLRIATGLGELAATHGVAVLGGDVTASPVLLLAVTVVGHLDAPENAVRRSGASPGDLVVVTGRLGGAGAGLLLLEQPGLEAAVGAAQAEELRHRHLEPVPRLAAGRALAAEGATAMIDLSDGLAGDARHVADASEVSVVVELERLPIQEGVGEVAAAAGVDPIDLAVSAGEDYELLLTLPPDRLAPAVAALREAGLELTEVGRVEPGGGLSLRRKGKEVSQMSGFDQLRSRTGRGEAA